MSEQSLNKLKRILTENGHRITSTRLALFEIFLNAEPLSLRQVFEKANNKIDRVSIYRNVELFETLDIVRRINIGWKYKLELSDTFVSHHHHLSCLSCGKIIDIDDELQIADFIKDITSKMSFTPLNHHFEIDGYCLSCSTNS